MDLEIDDQEKTCVADTSQNIDDLISKTDYTGHSLLHWAVQHNKLELCLDLVSRGCNVDQTDSSGTTPLMLAAYSGLADIVQLLLASGARTNITNDFGVDAVGMACANDNIDIVKLLNAVADDSNAEEVAEDCKCWPQHDAILSAACGSRRCLSYFYHLDKQTIHLTNNISGMNALMLAEAGGFTEMKSELVGWGAERNQHVKPYVPRLSLPALITPFVNISPMLSPSPLPLCCPTHQAVFLFPSTSCPSPSFQNLGSPNMLNLGSPNMLNLGSPNMLNLGSLNTQNLASPNMLNLSSPNMLNLGSLNTQNLGSPNMLNLGSLNTQNLGSPHMLNLSSPHFQCVGSPCLQNYGSSHLQNLGSPFRTNHPLTPNLCFSPKKNKKKNKPLSWLKKLTRKRSRSVENMTEVKRKKSDIDEDNILDYILSASNLSQYKSCFVNQEVGDVQDIFNSKRRGPG